MSLLLWNTYNNTQYLSQIQFTLTIQSCLLCHILNIQVVYNYYFVFIFCLQKWNIKNIGLQWCKSFIFYNATWVKCNKILSDTKDSDHLIGIIYAIKNLYFIYGRCAGVCLCVVNAKFIHNAYTINLLNSKLNAMLCAIFHTMSF